jgi:hypothetical protein
MGSMEDPEMQSWAGGMVSRFSNGGLVLIYTSTTAYLEVLFTSDTANTQQGLQQHGKALHHLSLLALAAAIPDIAT